ncbi:hypothetical protein [Arthrobacter psychrochitiniphilus]|uniref:Uncharacterized protein n=1 Tax=Arthrobacter psychrochitiniphilus TaxID=291045 RepID=A0A2V3DX48_9MICC|nr:hypothetical protein [Arthrobacter psychrochitiniphilus]NYG16413.1 hypothetical protein [Arthrobacter psychrochitiniphilus]PXA69435.1 hypothetical protein CVS29_02480 [Arthrobacter psychrochitiniphilus]
MSALLPTVFSTAGLLGGYQIARATKNRQLGGAVLAVAGAAAFLGWKKNAGTGTATALTATYVLAFGASHPLAKKMGSWPAVYTVTAATAVASLVFGRSKK